MFYESENNDIMKLDSRKVKNTKEKIKLLCLFFFSSFSFAFAQDPQYGLSFNGYSYEPELRTSLDLSPKGYLSFPNGFKMSFDVKFYYEDVHSYGYVFRISNKNQETIDFVFGEKNISFSSSLENIVYSSSLPDANIVLQKWIQVVVFLDFEHKKLTFQIGNIRREWIVAELDKFKTVDIVFGKNNYPKTQAVDVPTMTVKNLHIDEISGEALYFWKLSKYATNGVYDEINGKFASCENPNWVLRTNAIWNKEITFNCEKYPYLAFNKNNNTVAVVDQHFFYTYSLKYHQLQKKEVKMGFSYPRYANQMIYNSSDLSYYAYNLVKEEDGREFVAFDTIKSAWGYTTPHNHFSDYWHHNKYFSVKNSRLYVIGGYGHHKYKEGVFVYDLKSKIWSKQSFSGDTIEPRYLSGLGEISENKLLLFGGYGSKTGNQEISPQHYYDAFIIDIDSMKVKKIWTLAIPDENFVVSNSIVVDKKNKCFYALCYPFTKFNTAIRLYKFSMEKPEFEIMADTIPFGFKDSFSYVDLFFDNSRNSLIALTSSSVTKDSIASISIYSLAYPPLKKDDLYQEENKIIGWLYGLLGGTTLAIISLVFYFSRLKKRRLKIKKTIDDQNHNDIIPLMASNRINTVRLFRKQAIFLFGGFRVIDREGNDLSSEFKPLIKNLFLLILLNTIKNGRGISFIKLKELLWFDKTEESANNNRGVAMNKIKQILESVGEARFSKQGSYWSVEFSEDIYCDYYEALLLIRKIKENQKLDILDVKQLLTIALEGELLPSQQVEWADSFKSDFSNQFVDLLVDLINRKGIELSNSLCIDIANAIFIHDPLNEFALRLKCITQVKMGKNGLARNTYTAFVKEYATWFGTNFKYSFDQTISEI